MKKKQVIFIAVASLFTSMQAQINNKIVGKWNFAQVSLISPKAGYIPKFDTKENKIMIISMANFTFNEDGTATLSPEYMTKTGVTKATWAKNADETGIDIRYYFSKDSKFFTPNKNNYETLPWKITGSTDSTLTLNMHKFFSVDFKKAKN